VIRQRNDHEQKSGYEQLQRLSVGSTAIPTVAVANAISQAAFIMDWTCIDRKWPEK
jgi:hypothetical protein